MRAADHAERLDDLASHASGWLPRRAPECARDGSIGIGGLTVLEWRSAAVHGALQVSRAELHSSLLDRYSHQEPVNRVTFSILSALCEEAAKLAPGAGHELARAAVHVLKNALCDRSGRRHRDKTLLLQRAREFVDWHLREPDLSIGRVARVLNCTERSIQRAFHAQGDSFARYVMRSRLECCHRDLLSPCLAHQSVTQTAFSYGFVNLAHFSRAYKTLFGVSPRSARLTHAGTSIGVDSRSHARSLGPHGAVLPRYVR